MRGINNRPRLLVAIDFNGRYAECLLYEYRGCYSQ
jgi:hypothetical protein